MDKDILSLQLNIGTKVYYFDVKGNSGGMFVKIVEKRGDRRSNIIVPTDRLQEFADKLLEVFHATAGAPAADERPSPGEPPGDPAEEA